MPRKLMAIGASTGTDLCCAAILQPKAIFFAGTEGAKPICNRSSDDRVARDACVHPRDLLRRRLGLSRFPCGIVHAVDQTAGPVAAERPALGGGGLGDPVGEAVAAEAGEPHQVDILRVL